MLLPLDEPTDHLLLLGLTCTTLATYYPDEAWSVVRQFRQVFHPSQDQIDQAAS